MSHLVIGHLTPTDANPDPAVQGKLDGSIDVVFCDTPEEVQRTLLWYLDGIVKEIVDAPEAQKMERLAGFLERYGVQA